MAGGQNGLDILQTTSQCGRGITQPHKPQLEAKRLAFKIRQSLTVGYPNDGGQGASFPEWERPWQRAVLQRRGSWGPRPADRTAEVQEGALGGDNSALKTPQNSKLTEFETNYSMRWCVLYSWNAQLHGDSEFLSAMCFPEHALFCL